MVVCATTNARVEFGRKFQMKDASEQSTHKKRSEVGDLLVIHYAQKRKCSEKDANILCSYVIKELAHAWKHKIWENHFFKF